MRRAGDSEDFGTPDLAGTLWADAVAEISGPFVRSKVTPTAEERVMAEVIWRHQGRANPISIAVLCKVMGKSERTVKGLKQQLIVTHRMRIGARREPPAGYFVIVDKEDLALTVSAYQGQVIEMWRVLRVLLEGHELRRLHGQLEFEQGVTE